MHIVLLGDSIFDNASYTAGGPDVVAQLRAVWPDNDIEPSSTGALKIATAIRALLETHDFSAKRIAIYA